MSGLVALCLGLGLVAGWEYYILQQDRARLQGLQTQHQQHLDEVTALTVQLTSAESQAKAIEAKFSEAKLTADQERLATIDGLYQQYTDVVSKVGRNQSAKLDTAGIADQYASWGVKLWQKDYDGLHANLDKALADLDAAYSTYQKKLAATPPPTKTATPPANSGGSSSSAADGYTSTTVSTSRGSFSVNLIKLPLAQVTVKTVTANSDNCSIDCPTKSLAQYVAENGAYAGINGTYFCPPDYASCSSKKNSYDFAVYNSGLGKWLNQNALSWTSEGLATFSGHSAKFYRYANQYGGQAITAGIANFPPLLVQNGAVVISDGELDAAQKSKGLRGALGVDSSNVYLAVIRNASIMDAAYAMQALGAKDVLNLDGGGSSALYIGGSYKVGPGRSLPNALVLVKN